MQFGAAQQVGLRPPLHLDAVTQQLGEPLAHAGERGLTGLAGADERDAGGLGLAGHALAGCFAGICPLGQQGLGEVRVVWWAGAVGEQPAGQVHRQRSRLFHHGLRGLLPLLRDLGARLRLLALGFGLGLAQQGLALGFGAFTGALEPGVAAGVGLRALGGQRLALLFCLVALALCGGERLVDALLALVDHCHERFVEQPAQQHQQHRQVDRLQEQGPSVDVHGQFTKGLANSSRRAITRQ